jgi:condensation domain-containing protein
MTPGALPADHRRLLERRLSGRAFSGAGEHTSGPPGVTTDRTQTSSAQQRVWLMHKLAGGAAPAHVSALWRLSGGSLDIERLAQALAEVGRRHEVLRTRYRELDGEVRQFVWPDELPLSECVDLTGLPLPTALNRTVQAAAQDTARPIDLAKDAPVRLVVYRLRPDDHVLHACFHHIAVDGPSMALFWRELSAAYTALSLGQPMPAAPTVQYGDYAVWQNSWLDGAEAAQQVAFWRQFLADAPPYVVVPTDHDRPEALRGDAGVAVIDVPEETSAQLRSLACAESATQFMTLLTALYVCLATWTGQTDLVIGSPIAGRARPEFDDVIGVFVNTAALRLRWTGEPTFRELLGMTRDMTLTVYQNQELPFQRIVRELRPRRERNRNPIFNIWFDFVGEQPHPPFAGMRVSQVPVKYQSMGMDLALRVTDSGGRLSCALTYSTDLFEASTGHALASRFVRLLVEIGRHPDQRIEPVAAPAAPRPPHGHEKDPDVPEQ